MEQKPISVFWFRRDLRLKDNAGLYHALKSGLPVLPIFIFDTHILNNLSSAKDRRVQFIHETIVSLKQELNKLGSDLLVLHDTPENAWKKLFGQFQIKHIFANRDYEKYAINRDSLIEKSATKHNASFNVFKDQCIFEGDEIVKDDGTPYTVFTPYSRKWKTCLNDFMVRSYPSENYFFNLYKTEQQSPIPTLQSLGFESTDFLFPSKDIKRKLVVNYANQRDYPAIDGTSHLGIHFRFGTISIREKVKKAATISDIFLNELIWRDFYKMILFHFPKVNEGKSFKEAYDRIEWRNNEIEFQLWCTGKTGYPIVDAGIRQLNETGFMHNRVRMIVASFLTKHLLIDWRWGEAYFAEKLLDYDFSANNGGWQWAAGCGNDAAPYFRIFNPALQTKKFDQQNKYILKWVPELHTPDYPTPIVDHVFARNRCLSVYKKALSTPF